MTTDATGTPTSPDNIPTYNVNGDDPTGNGFNGAMAAIQTIITQLKAGTLPSGKIAPAGISFSAYPLVNADIAAAANVAVSKLAPGTNGQVITTTGGVAVWGVGTSSPGTELDYAQITTSVTGITVTTEGTAVTVVTGNSITYDGSKVCVEFFAPNQTDTGNVQHIFVIYRDATVIGHAQSGGFQPAGAQISKVFDTPPAGAHTYKVSVYEAGAGTGQINAGAGGAGNLLPAYLRVTKV